MRRRFATLGLILAIVGLVVLHLPVVLPIRAEIRSDPVDDLWSEMSVADRVGQLFVVSFVGNDAGPTSDIAHLIRQYRIGGVVLLPENGNFRNGEDTPRQLAELTAELQGLAYQSNGQGIHPESTLAGQSITPTVDLTTGGTPFIPLFLAVNQEGDGYPYSSVRGGLTPLPSNMALGATWKVEDAEKIGEIAGRELHMLGINMLLGPSLDILSTPRPGLQGDLAIRSFGGDPFWVGRFGQAYIEGVHAGSGGRVATVAKHFPGLGGADRGLDEEIPTVPKSPHELRDHELVPFVAVARGTEVQTVTDALMSSHIRYRGFQGNVRQLTRPISLDPQNLQALLAEPELAAWREAGGLMVSDSLGGPALRRYYDPQLQTFPYKRIAQEAFLAGNDLLILSRYGLTDDWTEQYEYTKATIQFFQEKYTADHDFQSRVDQSVRRILRTKYRLYGEFSYANVVAEPQQMTEALGKSEPAVLQIAKEAITLIYPGTDELADRMPDPPSLNDGVLIFSDVREARECEQCPTQTTMASDALEQVMVRLYGPKGSGQIDPAKIHSFTFAQLRDLLLAPGALPEGATGVNAGIEAFINEADWIIFAMLDVNPEETPASTALKMFLKLRSDGLRGKKIVAMAYGAPYYLDTTEISKLTAYYGVYSKVQPFIEASVRALFQEYTPGGALPVSVEGINYDLSAQHGILTPTSVSIETPSTQPGQTVATTPSPSATPAAQAQPRPRVTPVDLFLSLLGMAVLHLVGDLLRWRKGWTRVYRLRLSLMGVACGLVGYLIYALRMLGTGELWRVYGHWGAVLFAVALGLIPLGTALIARGIRATR